MNLPPLQPKPNPSHSARSSYPTINLDTPSCKSLIISAPTCCPICLDDAPSDGFIKPLSCGHTFCKSCVTQYLIIKIESFQVFKIACPFSECDQLFSEKTVKEIVDPATFKTYQDAVLKKVMSRDTNLKFCPKPGCLRQFKPCLKRSFTTCVCKTEICNICCNPWHPNKTCLEAIDPEFQVFAKEENIKFCMICKSHVQRVEGCKHITCPICDYEWCWDCGREYSTNHQAECLKEWSPIPPCMSAFKKLRHNYGKGPLWKRILFRICTVLIFPFVLLQFLLFWPLWVYCDPHHDLSFKRPFKSLAIILGCGILGVVLAPVMIGVGITIVISHIIFLPFNLLYDGPNNSRTRPEGEPAQAEKRWINKKPESFHYTSKARPGGNEGVEVGRQVDLEAQIADRIRNSPETRRTEQINTTRIWGMAPFTGVRIA